MKRQKALVVEFHNHHDEVLPSLCGVLEALGYEVTVMTTAQNLKKDAFCLVSEARPKRFIVLGPWRRAALHAGLGKLLIGGYDLVVYNSIEPVRLLQLIQKIGARAALGVIHNGILTRSDPRYRALLAQPGFGLLALERFVSEKYLGTPKRAIYPYFLSSQELPKAQKALFCVQGTFDYNRRNYETLLTALREFKERGETGIAVRFIGNVRSNDFHHFVSRCQEFGVEPMVEFLRGGHDYRSYFAQIAECSFLLPLLEPGVSAIQPYFDSTASSSVTMGVGLGVIPLVHEELAELYGLHDASVTYGSRSLYQAMSEATRLSSERVGALRQSLGNLRNRRWVEAQDNVRTAIHEVMGSQVPHV